MGLRKTFFRKLNILELLLKSKSLSRKIVFSYFLILMASSIISGFIFYSVVMNYYISETRVKSQQIGEFILSQIAEMNESDLSREKARAAFRTKLKVEIAKKQLQISTVILDLRHKPVFSSIHPDVEEDQELNDLVLYTLLNTKKMDISALNDKRFVIYPIVLDYENVIAPGGKLYILIKLEDIRRITTQLLVSYLSVLPFSMLLVFVAGIGVAKTITNPLQNLKIRADKLSHRQYDEITSINTGDEIEDLNNAFSKMAIALKEYDSAQKKFLQNASHELKTPLMSIQGYAEGIRDEVFTGEEKEKSLNVIIEESTRLKRIVDEIIYLSKLETLEEIYDFNWESLNNTLEECVSKVNGLALKKGINLKYTSNCSSSMLIDKDKITQALINLLSNAIRHARNTVRIDCIADGEDIMIQISDDGEGFQENVASRLFDRFYKGVKGDTGLGLAITKSIIEKHKGTVTAVNVSSGGARFTVRFKK